MLSRHDNVGYARSLLAAGALGYVPKNAVSSELGTAIRTVYSGGVFLHPSVAKGITQHYVHLVQLEGNEDPYQQLTKREKEILMLLGEGYSSSQIADKLCLAVKTVHNHRENIMAKLGMYGNTQLIKFAVERGLVDDNS